jgi:hypothetical protein
MTATIADPSLLRAARPYCQTYDSQRKERPSGSSNGGERRDLADPDEIADVFKAVVSRL